ncbi:MAG: hypothetical protein KAW09_01290 [Thermoplasmata archaeon]|nr:hypothetical protein [Thermoplasmata archaeon]
MTRNSNADELKDTGRWRNLTLPRIYFDSDALIKGMIEILPEVQKHPEFSNVTSDARNEIPLAQRILNSWNPDHLTVSMFTILEALNCGFRKYGLSHERLLPIVRKAIGVDFSVVFADFELVGRESRLVEELEGRFPDRTTYAVTRASGITFDEDGKELGRARWGGTLSSGAAVNKWYSGLYDERTGKKSIEDVDSHSISSPKVERELFLRTVDLAVKFGIAPKDSIHILYATGNAEYIVTTDSGFLKVLNRDPKHFPRGLRPSEVLRRWGDRLDRWS